MPLHPQCKSVLDQMAASGGKPIEECSVAEARAARAARSQAMKALAGPAQEVARVANLSIDSLPIRVYWPSAEAPLPVLVYFHGGGFVLGDLEMVDVSCRSMANAAQCIVVSVAYRLAPEHKFPAPVEDAYLTIKHVVRHAKELGADPNRIAVGGDSAGGNLAAAAALKIRNEGGPGLAFQLLVYPVTDYDDNRPSLREYSEGYFLTAAAMKWFWGHYLRSPRDGYNPYASPLKAASFQGLPPAMVITAECDPIRDQGEAYAEKLRAADVPVTVKRYEGAIHGFLNMAGMIDGGKIAQADAARALREAFASEKSGQSPLSPLVTY
jgi:acetyl esterase